MSKLRIVDALENLAERLRVIDEAQAEMLGSIELIREGVHACRNALTPVVAISNELALASEHDQKEITKILTRIDEINRRIGTWQVGIDRIIERLDELPGNGLRAQR